MPTTLDSCQKYFGTRDVYKLFEVTKDSLEKDIKKAYYKLSLKVHPDRVEGEPKTSTGVDIKFILSNLKFITEEEKEIATEKFKVLTKLHQVLTDKNRKALYDDKGIIDDDDEEGLSGWLEIWKTIFKPISEEDIDNYQKTYVDSELERTDIKKAYVNGKGCINYMMNTVPFMNVEDEPRISKIVQDMIDAGEVPEFKAFTNEPKSKRDRRHNKYSREKREAAEIERKIKKKNNHLSLEQQIVKRQQEREANASSFFDKLMQKYGGEDDSEAFSIEDIGKVKKKTKTTKKPNKKIVVKNGRVTRSTK